MSVRVRNSVSRETEQGRVRVSRMTNGNLEVRRIRDSGRFVGREQHSVVTIPQELVSSVRTLLR